MPDVGVTSIRAMFTITSKTITSSSSLLWAHVPDQLPLFGFGVTLVEESLQVVANPCCGLAVPDVISADLSSDAWTSIAASNKVRLLLSSLSSSAFPVG